MEQPSKQAVLARMKTVFLDPHLLTTLGSGSRCELAKSTASKSFSHWDEHDYEKRRCRQRAEVAAVAPLDGKTVPIAVPPAHTTNQPSMQPR